MEPLKTVAPAKRVRAVRRIAKRGKVRVKRKVKLPPERLEPHRESPQERAQVSYSFDLSERICERLANGESATSITRDAAMPSWAVLQRWLREKPDFARRYKLARESGYEFWADQTVDIADETQTGQVVTTQEWGTQVRTSDMLEHRRLRIDARKWLLGKRARHIYGEKVSTELSGPDGQPIEVAERNALIDAIVKLVHPKDDPKSRPEGQREESRER